MKKIKLYEMGKFKGYIYPENTAFEVEMYKTRCFLWDLIKTFIGIVLFIGGLYFMCYITQGI